MKVIDGGRNAPASRTANDKGSADASPSLEQLREGLQGNSSSAHRRSKIGLGKAFEKLSKKRKPQVENQRTELLVRTLPGGRVAVLHLPYQGCLSE
jgi:hypothetical protein